MTTKYLTGRKRHRLDGISYAGYSYMVENDKLILQIEEESYTPRSPYEYGKETKLEWRDARVEDVTLQQAEQKEERL